MSEWNLKGKYFESCNCETACPCIFLSPPTEGECTVLVAWHIEEGKFGDTDLAGLNVALAVHSPGPMHEVKWKAAVYLDAKADEAQTNALGAIFGGQAGGHPAGLVSHVGELLGVAKADISFTAADGSRSIKVGDNFEMTIEAAKGQGGGDMTVSGHALAIAPGFPAVLGRSKSLTYNDHGYNWSYSGKSGQFSPFQYSN